MTSKVTYSGKDYGGESTRTGMFLPDVTGANFAAVDASVTAMQTAIEGVSLIDFDGIQWLARAQLIGGNAPLPAAQRELKWLVRYTDPTNAIGNGSFEIGGADTALLAVGTDFMNLAAGAGLALKTAIEANLVSRLGNSIVMDSAQLVGRTI